MFYTRYTSILIQRVGIFDGIRRDYTRTIYGCETVGDSRGTIQEFIENFG